MNPNAAHWIYASVDIINKKIILVESYRKFQFIKICEEAMKFFWPVFLAELQNHQDVVDMLAINPDDDTFWNFSSWKFETHRLGNQNDSVTCGVFTLFGIERDIKMKKTIIKDNFSQHILRREGRMKILLTLYDYYINKNLVIEW